MVLRLGGFECKGYKRTTWGIDFDGTLMNFDRLRVVPYSFDESYSRKKSLTHHFSVLIVFFESGTTWLLTSDMARAPL